MAALPGCSDLPQPAGRQAPADVPLPARTAASIG